MKSLILYLFILLSVQGFSQTDNYKPLRHFMQAGPSPANEIQYGNNPKAGHYVNAGDAKIYYEVYGQGKPIVILHGGIFGSTYEMFQFIDSLSKKYKVIAVSTRGHGKSTLGTRPITDEQKANDVMAVIDAETRDSVIILGFSDGGYAGYKVASMYPGRVRKLIAIGATELYPGLRDFTFDVKKGVSLDSVYWKQQLMLMPDPQSLPEMFTRLGKMYSQLSLDKGFFETIQCPVLVMAGDKDQGNPPARVVTTAQMIGNHEIGIIPNCGHAVFLENFPAVWACIVPFLNQKK
jgi:pimeloyl-ACP methyl ester carboxylesterase